MSNNRTNFHHTISIPALIMLATLGCTPGPIQNCMGAETGGEDGGEVIVTQSPNVGSRWSCMLSADLAAAHEVRIGDQVRLRLDPDGYDALFTVTEIFSGSAEVRVSSGGLARLGGDAGCGTLVTRIAPVQMTSAEASGAWEFIEQLEQGDPGHGLLVLVPHGRDIEAHTDELGRLITDNWPGPAPTYWACLGFDGELDAFDRFHCSSDVISPRSFPLLATITADYERVISIHGHAGPNGGCMLVNDVVIGGRAPDQLLSDLRDAIDANLDAYDVALAKPEWSCTGTNENNIVNRLSVCGGVQLELGWDVRNDPEALTDMAAAIIEVFAAWPGC